MVEKDVSRAAAISALKPAESGKAGIQTHLRAWGALSQEPAGGSEAGVSGNWEG